MATVLHLQPDVTRMTFVSICPDYRDLWSLESPVQHSTVLQLTTREDSRRLSCCQRHLVCKVFSENSRTREDTCKSHYQKVPVKEQSGSCQSQKILNKGLQCSAFFMEEQTGKNTRHRKWWTFLQTKLFSTFAVCRVELDCESFLPKQEEHDCLEGYSAQVNTVKEFYKQTHRPWDLMIRETAQAPQRPPMANMDTVTDQSSVSVLARMGSP